MINKGLVFYGTYFRNLEWLQEKLCTKTNFLSVSRKHLFCYIPGNLGAILRFQYSFDYRKRNNARHTLYIAHLKLLETVSAPIYYQHLIFHLKKTFPALTSFRLSISWPSFQWVIILPCFLLPVGFGAWNSSLSARILWKRSRRHVSQVITHPLWALPSEQVILLILTIHLDIHL